MMNRQAQSIYNIQDCTDMAVFEHQTAHPTNGRDLLLHEQTVYHPDFAGNFSGYFPDPLFTNSGTCAYDEGWLMAMAGSLEPNPCLRTAWPSSGLGLRLGFRLGVSTEKMSGPGSFKKRKGVDNVEEDPKEEEKKKMRVNEEESEEKSKMNYKPKKESSSNSSSNDDSKDFIRVRARRGQATDSHSVAERMRREKISERMKFLQGLVPGCRKITGKVGMLDEIINYVQSLERQVEFLMMKWAALNPNPSPEFSFEESFTNEDDPCMMIPTSEIIPSGFDDQLSPTQQAVSWSDGTDAVLTSSSDVVRTTDRLLCITDTLISPASENNGEALSTLESDMKDLYTLEFHYDQTPLTPFASQSHTGSTSTT